MPPVAPPRDPKRDAELVAQLLTCDGVGKTVKRKILAELLQRAALLGPNWNTILTD